MKIREGDKIAFATLYQKYKNEVFGLLMRLVKNRSKAEDLAQEAWMKVIHHAHQFSGSSEKPNSARSWILTIARNLALDEVKKDKKWILVENDDLDQHLEVQMDDSFWQEYEAAELKKCFDDLQDRQRFGLTLFYYEQKSLIDLGAILEIDINAVKALLFRGRQNLLQCLNRSLSETKMAPIKSGGRS